MTTEVEVKMPPRDVTLLRYYYWPANTEPQLDPMPLAEALLLAKSLDVQFPTRAPQDLLKVLDKDAFAFQFVRITNDMTGLGRLKNMFGAQPDYKRVVDPQVYLVGDYDLSLKGELMLRTTVGHFVLPDGQAQMLRREDLRNVCCYYDASAPQQRAPAP
jgi:hypothetical protein